jgi:uncharacterized protein (UPF0548 family)
MISMTSQRARREPLEARREFWDSRPATAALTDRVGRHDRYSIELLATPTSGTASLLERARAALLRYDIYPPQRMRHLVCSADGNVHNGTLIIQRICVGPTAIEAAVRVVELVGMHEPGEVLGFSYVTLQGHAEKGVASFRLVPDEQDATGK